MCFYNLSKEERKQKYFYIQSDIALALLNIDYSIIKQYFDDTDLYNAY